MDPDHDPSPVDPIGDDTGEQTEQQPGEALRYRGQGYQERIMGFGRHEQWAGGQRDPAAKISCPGRSEKPPEGQAQPSRCDRLTETCHSSASHPGAITRAA
jgi:hypothetical protein